MSGDFAGLTIDAARRHLAGLLRAHGIDSPELDARILAGAALGLDLTGLAVNAARVIDTDEAGRLAEFARRRIAGEPVARIIGHKEFWGLTLALSPATLVPRPDTETIVDAAIGLVRAQTLAPPRRILDIGTGSGAILLALLSEFPQAFGVGCDIDADALATAAANARALGLASRAGFVRSDYASPLVGPFDLVVSNPPYIPTGEIATLAVEVRAHDPRRALDGGADGLDAYRRIAPQAAALLAPGGVVLLEVGLGQAADVARLIVDAGLDSLPSQEDLAGVARVVAGQKCGRKPLPEQ